MRITMKAVRMRGPPAELLADSGAMTQKSSYRNEAAYSSPVPMTAPPLPLPRSHYAFVLSATTTTTTNIVTIVFLFLLLALNLTVRREPRFGIDVHDKKGSNMGEEVFKLE